jgi:colanic acid biosynthesis glycosyl transferase WcaI
VTFLLLNQTFYPDVMATGQYLQEVAVALVERGHEVTVVTSRRAYDHPEKRFPNRETWNGIRIYRVASTGFGKTAKWRRAADFASFIVCCAVRLALLPRHDAVVALTSPPLISFLGAWLAKLRRCRFFYWVMDLNPDEAIAAGWLRPDSLLGKVFESMSRFSFRRATKIIALDRFMRDRIVAKGIDSSKIAVIPPWSHDSEVRLDQEGRESFRQSNNLAGKFVVMYSGNHSPCHPLDTLLDVAQRLRADPGVVFCFIGGGSEFRKIQQLPPSNNVFCLPYQPLSQLAGSLSAADLHIVVMGEPFVGIVHPCKLYNILSVGAPVLYIGPQPSHLSEMLNSMNGQYPWGAVRHGDVDGVLEQIAQLRKQNGRPCPQPLNTRCSKQTLLPQLVDVLESPKPLIHANKR